MRVLNLQLFCRILRNLPHLLVPRYYTAVAPLHCYARAHLPCYVFYYDAGLACWVAPHYHWFAHLPGHYLPHRRLSVTRACLRGCLLHIYRCCGYRCVRCRQFTRRARFTWRYRFDALHTHYCCTVPLSFTPRFVWLKHYGYNTPHLRTLGLHPLHVLPSLRCRTTAGLRARCAFVPLPYRTLPLRCACLPVPRSLPADMVTRFTLRCTARTPLHAHVRTLPRCCYGLLPAAFRRACLFLCGPLRTCIRTIPLRFT